MKRIFLAQLLLIVCAGVSAQELDDRVVNGPHNLLAGSKAKAQEVCIRCHTPKVTQQIRPLWDPESSLPATDLISKQSASSGRPTGASKQCLVCHDGMIAQGNIVLTARKIESAERLTTLHAGKGSFLNDLSDDHPISFKFDAALTAKNTKLRDPGSLTGPVHLDKRGEMQCTSCHNPHDNSNSKFLVTSNANSQLCNSCHRVGTTTVVHHMECSGCHQNHTAPSGEKLLKRETITSTCLSCHGGEKKPPQGPNIADEISKFASHDTNPPIDLARHAPAESACTDCHDSHTMKTALVDSAPLIRAVFGEVPGISAIGKPVNPARFEYQICFKCHGDQQAVEPEITRAIRQKNLRLKFSVSAVSSHPVEARGKNPRVTSLKPPITTASIIYCTDCHSSDAGKKAGGSGASGPHGSENAGLLVAEYDRADYSSESAAAYALCYRCHERSSILSDRSFKLHKLHIVDQKAACSSCHDPHGISAEQGTAGHNNSLINFDVRIVRKSSTGVREFNSTGINKGNCSLTCHGNNHIGFGY